MQKFSNKIIGVLFLFGILFLSAAQAYEAYAYSDLEGQAQIIEAKSDELYEQARLLRCEVLQESLGLCIKENKKGYGDTCQKLSTREVEYQTKYQAQWKDDCQVSHLPAPLSANDPLFFGDEGPLPK